MKGHAQWLIIYMVVTFIVAACTIPPSLNEPAISPRPTELIQPDSSITDVKPEGSVVSSIIQLPSSPEVVVTETPVSANEIGLANTVILYTTVDQMPATQISSTTDSNAPQVDYWGLKTLPSLPIFEHPIFDTFYGEVAKAQGIADYFFNFRPQLSPNGRYLLLPGIGGFTPPGGNLGAGLWLTDLAGDTLLQLLPQAKIATWNPASDTITYVEGDTLYTLAITEGATPTPLFSHPNLWGLYAHWSPDGRWIASVTTVQGEPDAQGSPELTNTYWLIPANGGSPRELAVKQDFAMEYTAGEMAWSHNGQLLMMRNEVFNLAGKKVGSGFPGRANWLPNQAQLLVNGHDGLRLMTLNGEDIIAINDSFASAWAFSHDGQRLAYSQPNDDEKTTLWIFDLVTYENQWVSSMVSSNVSLLRWSSDDKHLIVGGGQENNSLIWMIEVKPNGSVVPILENALLVEVIGNISAITPALGGVESTTVETAESTTTPTMPLPANTATPTATAMPITPTTAETIVTPFTPSASDSVEEWLIYENDFFSYRFSYPSGARIRKQGVTGFPTEELPENMTTEAYWEQLETTYPGDLCVSVQYGSGFVTFVPSDEKGGRYTVPCGVTGVGDYDLTNVAETVLINDQPCTASGWKLFRQDEPDAWQGEFYFLTVDDTITIHFGSLDGTQEQFLDAKDTLLQIIASLRTGEGLACIQ